MFCIFEQPLVSARVRVRVINAKHENRGERREDGRGRNEDVSLMKKSYGRSRIVLLRDARPRPRPPLPSTHLPSPSLPFSKCPSSHIRRWLLRL